MTDAKEKDLQLWVAWKQNRSPQNTDALIKQMGPLIAREVGRWSNVAPRFLLENEAKALALKAFESYDPTRGVALGTHVTNGLMKLSRTAYARQSTLSVPEAKRLTFNRIHHEKTRLEEELGRAPSLDELSDHLAMPQAKVRALVAEVGKRELMESGEGPAFVQHADDPEAVHLAWHDMTPVQRQVFEMRTGYNGRPVAKGATEIMRATGLTQGQLSHQLEKIKVLLARAQRLR